MLKFKETCLCTNLCSWKHNYPKEVDGFTHLIPPFLLFVICLLTEQNPFVKASKRNKTANCIGQSTWEIKRHSFPTMWWHKVQSTNSALKAYDIEGISILVVKRKVFILYFTDNQYLISYKPNHIAQQRSCYFKTGEYYSWPSLSVVFLACRLEMFRERHEYKGYWGNMTSVSVQNGSKENYLGAECNENIGFKTDYIKCDLI